MGSFTPSLLTYSPYKNLITRLSGHDNILTGESSFIIEMKELSTILKNSDENSLIVGDELCRGTEGVSGPKLTIATILTLLKRKSTFIFSSHMHQLTKNQLIKEVSNDKLYIQHLTIA